MLAVKVIYVAADNTLIQHDLNLNEGATVMDALNQSGIYRSHPEIMDYPLGIFSKRVNSDTPLREGDRVEIYRPLLVDPMEKRRQRAKRVKK